jgi:hypothetical protein
MRGSCSSSRLGRRAPLSSTTATVGPRLDGYVQLVYGRQLQQPMDEQPADPLDVSTMTRDQRDALKRRILAQTGFGEKTRFCGQLRGGSRPQKEKAFG